ncbi:MAG: hypothetical protein WCI01_07215 [Chlorobiaceae bacterium]
MTARFAAAALPSIFAFPIPHHDANRLPLYITWFSLAACCPAEAKERFLLPWQKA